MSPETSGGAPPLDSDSNRPEPRRFRLPRARRIRARAEFVKVQSASPRIHTPHFLILLSKTPPSIVCDGARLGVTVTRKVANAVARNRIKRVLREAFRLDVSLFAPGVDVVFIAKNGAQELGLAAVQAELHRARAAIRRRVEELVRATG